jgi:ribulose-phosphate 3-epimerase
MMISPGGHASIWDRFPVDRLLVDVSLWSADLSALGREVRRLEPHADMVHIDVADGHFVPRLLFFPDLVAAIRPFTALPMHVHLMVERPSALVDAFVDAGADILTVHHEVGADATAAVERIRLRARAPGVALRLDSEVEEAGPYLDDVELVLLLGTAVGVKGAEPAPEAEGRVARLDRLLRERGVRERVKIEADGGLRRHTVPGLRAAGADLISPGSLIFGSGDWEEVFGWARGLPRPGSVPVGERRAES